MNEQHKGRVVKRSASFNSGLLNRVAATQSLPAARVEHHYDVPEELMHSRNMHPSLPRKHSHESTSSGLPPPPPPVPPRDNPKADNANPAAIVGKFENAFPLKLVIDGGVYGSDQADTLCDGEEIMAHFLRQVPYVTVEMKTGVAFKVPVATCLHFGIVYNGPGKKLEMAVAGYMFRTVEDILQQTVMPKLVVALKGWRGKDPSHTVEENDLLWIKGLVGDPKDSKVKFLKCIQAITGLDKFLRSDAMIPLSTKPSLLLLPLIKIIKHVQPPFQCVVDCQQNSSHSLPSLLKGMSVVTVQEHSHITSIIATRKCSDSSSSVLEIPTILDVGMSIVETSEFEKNQMRMEAAALYTSFSTMVVNQGLLVQALTSKMRNSPATQKLLLTLMDKDYKKITQRLIPPPSIKSLLPNSVSAGDNSSKTKLNGKDRPAATDSSGRLQLVEQGMQLLISEVKTIKEQFLTLKSLPLMKVMQELEGAKTLASSAFDQIPGIFSEMKTMTDRITTLEKKYLSVVDTLTQVKHSLEQQQSWIQQLELQAAEQPSQQNEVDTTGGLDPYQNVSFDSQSTTCTDNISYLETLTVSQVVELLHALKISRYAEEFTKEDISGWVLVNCTEDLLEKELNVTSALHRMKLMQVIRGKTSAKALTTQRYVTMK